MAQRIKIIYTNHAKKRMRRRSFMELDVERAINFGKKSALYDEPNKYAFQLQNEGGRKYEVVCYVIGNIYKVKTIYPL